jgi:hypothetical protein
MITNSDSLCATYRTEEEMESKLTSLKATYTQEDKSVNPENTIDKMDNHVQLLVGTLETVAKELIEICKDAN